MGGVGVWGTEDTFSFHTPFPFFVSFFIFNMKLCFYVTIQVCGHFKQWILGNIISDYCLWTCSQKTEEKVSYKVGPVNRGLGGRFVGLDGWEGLLEPCFSRHLNYWELDNVERFFSTLQGKVVNREKKDMMVWTNLRNDAFFVKSLYVTLESGSLILFSVRVIWNPCVPSKASFFVWKACWGKVLTLDHI